jgi:hypothetical protein
MQDYWISFVHDLSPSAKEGPKWQKYSDAPKVLDIQNYNSGSFWSNKLRRYPNTDYLLSAKMLDDTYRQDSIEFLINLADKY